MRKILALILALLLCCGFLVFCEKEEAPSSPSNGNSSSSIELPSESSSSAKKILAESLNNKVSARLKEYVDSTDGDYVSIYVRIESATNSEEALFQNMEERLGKDYSYSKNFEKRIILYEDNLQKLKDSSKTPILLTPEGEVDIKQFTPQELIGLMGLVCDDELEYSIKGLMEDSSAYEIISWYERNEYMNEYRESRTIIDKKAKEEFYELLNADKCRSIEQSPILAWFYLDCERSYLLEIQEIPMVQSIGLS